MLPGHERVAEFNRAHTYGSDRDCHFVAMLRSGGLTDEQIALVIETMEHTCNQCWDSHADCQCWNDE